MKFVVYEIWTKSKVVEAETLEAALEQGYPTTHYDDGLSLANWHAVPVFDLTTPHVVDRNVHGADLGDYLDRLGGRDNRRTA